MEKSVVAVDGTRPVSVLTVDDQPVFRRVARAVVEATDGFDVVAEAASGEHALRLAGEHSPDLVLIDVRMSDMDGLEAAARIKCSCPEAVVVLISAEAESVAVDGLVACGAAEFLHKKELRPAALSALWARHGTRGPRQPLSG